MRSDLDETGVGMVRRITQSNAGEPRGLLNPAPAQGAFRHWRRLPAADLRFFIQHFWMVSWDLRGAAPFVQETVPHPTVHLVLADRESRIVGVVKARFRRVLEGKGRVFGVKFRPGGFYPFARSPISQLTNRMIAPSVVFGDSAAQFEQAVLSLEDEPEMIEVAEAFFRDRAPDRDESAMLAGRIADYIASDREITTVDDVVARFSIGKRALQRLFDQYVGVSPKWVIRVYRLNEAIERIKAGEHVDFAGLSQDLGYFDQAHFVRDFKAVVGRTPGEYLKGEHTAAPAEAAR